MLKILRKKFLRIGEKKLAKAIDKHKLWAYNNSQKRSENQIVKRLKSQKSQIIK